MPTARWSRQLVGPRRRCWAWSALNGSASTADRVSLGESLVVRNGPSGSRHHSLSDGVGAVEEKVLGEEESVSVEQDSHVVARIIMQIIFKPSTRINHAASR